MTDISSYSPKINKSTVHQRDKSKGFTLVELVIVIIILSAVSIATSSYIATGLNIYNDITERDKGLNSVRFVMERMQREIANALPNSIKSYANPDLENNQCLSFYPVKSSSIYSDFPIYPLSGLEGKMGSVADYEYVSGDRAVVYLLQESELNASSTLITGVNDDKDTLYFSATTSFPLSSPAKRVYIVNDIIQYCFLDSDLYRQKNSDTSVLMAENVVGDFEVVDATLLRNGLVKVAFTLTFDEQEVAFEKAIHISNVP